MSLEIDKSTANTQENKTGYEDFLLGQENDTLDLSNVSAIRVDQLNSSEVPDIGAISLVDVLDLTNDDTLLVINPLDKESVEQISVDVISSNQVAESTNIEYDICSDTGATLLIDIESSVDEY